MSHEEVGQADGSASHTGSAGSWISLGPRGVLVSGVLIGGALLSALLIGVGLTVYAADIFTLDDGTTVRFRITDAGSAEIKAGGSDAALKVTQDSTGNILSLFDGASEAVTVANGGNLGIGNITPSAKLHIGDGTTTAGIIIDDNVTGGVSPTVTQAAVGNV